jgi:hypothetical protein
VERRIVIARILVTIPALFIAVGPPIADLNETHVLNPEWIGHARLHTVWLLSTNSLVAVLALALLWRLPLDSPRDSVLAGAALVGSVLLGFFVAAATQSAYGGSLTDPNGIAVTAGPIDANLAAFSLLSCLVVAAVFQVRRRGA